MEFAVEAEETSGGVLQRVAEGVRLSPESGREGVRVLAGMEEASGGEKGKGFTGRKKTENAKEGSGQKAEEMRMDLTVVKQEVVDWSDIEGGLLNGQWVKQEVEDGPEVKDEKTGILEVKQEVDNSSLVVKEEKVDELGVKEEKVKEEVMDWPEVKEEKEDYLEIKQEIFVGQDIKEEEMMDGACVKEEKDFMKKEMMEDTKVKEEPEINPPLGCKRKLAMSSLPCVKKHKAELTCNGVRNKTAFVSIQQFTEMNLLSDYRFLEDVARTADHISRDVFLKRPISNKHMCFLKNRARKQGIDLKLLPTGFTKRKENSTIFDKKKQKFCWHVKLQFPQSQAEYIEKRVPEDKTINEILKPYVDPEKSDPVIRQRLKAYIHSQTEVQILMKVEYMQQNLVRYYELDPYKSLLDNLKNKVIIEYPTLYVVLKGSSDDMKVLHQVKNESTKNLGSEN
ncbi:box C/D snoRNA protein 1 isoform X2 [Marmota marmota marmota]|uniref:Zinc finger HIT-type containing 6 n=1 Tax=Marmota marmota marmota TaxID=9994 RepID=A0A8C6ERA2_MARMA|nr:box C/D snoRNA protein 1 isoform X2 [Marmota marmota marmota]